MYLYIYTYTYIWFRWNHGSKTMSSKGFGIQCMMVEG